MDLSMDSGLQLPSPAGADPDQHIGPASNTSGASHVAPSPRGSILHSSTLDIAVDHNTALSTRNMFLVIESTSSRCTRASPSKTNTIEPASQPSSTNHSDIIFSPLPMTKERAEVEIVRLSAIFGISVTINTSQAVSEVEAVSPLPHTLLTIPKEIRIQILELLLHNPVLGRPDSICMSGWYTSSLKYGLTPAILTVCRQLRSEGYDVLYSQKFYIVSLAESRFHISPLLRYYYDHHSISSPLRNYSTIKYIRRWIIVVDGDTCRNYPNRPPVFLDLCRSINIQSAASIQVCVLPKLDTDWHLEGEYDLMSNVLVPLQNLRLKPGILRIRDIDASEWPGVGVVSRIPTYWVSCLTERNTAQRDTLIKKVEGSTPVEYGYKMYEALLRYCQCFERYFAFKEDMALWDDEESPEETYGDACSTCDQYVYDLRNPYKVYGRHPVEEGLQEARIAAEVHDDIALFKVHREKVLMYLERQYEAINNASTAVLQFVKENKKRYGLLGPDADSSEHGCHVNFSIAQVLLDDYAKSFVREAPMEVRAAILIQKHRFDKLYYEMDREILLRQLHESVAKAQRSRTLKCFYQLLHDLDTQLIEIRLARRELFLHDMDKKNLGVDMHPCDPSSVDHIVWGVEEPNYDVPLGQDPDPETEAGESAGGDGVSDDRYSERSDGEDVDGNAMLADASEEDEESRSRKQ